MITDRINNNLAAIYDTENDVLYKTLISNKNGTIPTTILKPTDIDLGAKASMLEYLRRLSINLVTQMYIDQAEAEFLTYILNNFFDSLQLEDETDSEWIQRVIATVFQNKVSNASIIYYLRPYSTIEPMITNIIQESAYADFCFADAYNSGLYTMSDGTLVVWLPALAENFQSTFFTVKITLYNTATADIWTVQNILRKVLAAGISYILEIQYT